MSPGRMRLVVLGGSGASTPEFADAIAAWPNGEARRGSLEIVLHGRSIDKLALVGEAFRQRLAIDSVTEVSVSTSTDIEAALEGADVVLVQVRIGGLVARAFDESFPRSFGIPGEETMGPGGFANALRTVPALRSGWEAIARHAPTALVLDLTNPAGIVVAAAVREFGLRALEVCDSPVTLIRAVAKRLERSEADITARYIGCNHLGWWVPEKDHELTAVAPLAVGFTPDEVLLQGAMPVPYVRYYLTAERILEAQGSGPTRAETLLELERDLLAAYASGAREVPRRDAAWYPRAVVPFLDAHLNGSVAPVIAGLPSDGRSGGPAGGVVVERGVTIAKRGAAPEAGPAPVLPPLPAALLAAHAAYESLTVEALATGASRQALVRALAANPMVRDIDLAAQLVDAIIERSPRA